MPLDQAEVSIALACCTAAYFKSIQGQCLISGSHEQCLPPHIPDRPVWQASASSQPPSISQLDVWDCHGKLSWCLKLDKDHCCLIWGKYLSQIYHIYGNYKEVHWEAFNFQAVVFSGYMIKYLPIASVTSLSLWKETPREYGQCMDPDSLNMLLTQLHKSTAQK